MDEQKRKEEYLRDQKAFRENAFNIIEMMLDLCNQTPGSKHLVDEMLHCIFFLGQVNNIRYTPENIISDKEMLAGLTKIYPEPLKKFPTQLPKRSPFSCVMDMIVKLGRPENENQIKQRLRKIIRDLKVNKDQTEETLRDILAQLRDQRDVGQIQRSLMNIISQLGEEQITVGQIRSSLMDIIRQLEGKKNVDQIKKSLMDLVNRMGKWFLMSTTMCVSQPPNSANKYYGVSMSTTGPNPGRIVIAAACLSNWDDYVAEAVMAYSWEKKEREKKKGKGKGKGKGSDDNQDLNGTITFPKGVKCQAFSLSTGDQMDPCKSCGELFGLQTNETKGWVYGNCAEAESLSNLLKNEQEVKKQTKREAQCYTPQNRQKYTESMCKDLKDTLSTVQFKTWDGQFYTPQNK